MPAPRYFLLAATIGVLSTGLCLLQCAPEELVYKASGGAAGAGGDGSAGDGPVGVGGTNTWAEICGNGIDDDNNGKTDCEDPACSNYACVDLPPSGWSGPVALYQGAPDSLASCPKGLTDVYDGNADPSYSPAQCGTCSCGSPTASDCSVAVSYYGDTACSVLVSSYSFGSGASCSAADGNAIGSVSISISSSGSCGAGTPATPTIPPPTWKSAARACALGSGTGKTAGCASGKVCAPLSSDSLACVYQTGEVACPAGYPARHVFYGSFDDTRSCGACGCNYADDGCSTTVTGYAGTDCSSPNLTTSSPGCNVAAVHSFTASGGPSNPRCDPGASAPSGCVAPATPTTLCCSGYAGTPCPSAHGPAMVQVAPAGGAAYCIDSTEVTKAQYDEFLATSPSVATQPAQCLQWNTTFTPSGFGQNGPPDSPVTYVDWCDAYAYCAWAGKRLCGKIGGGALPVSAADDATQSQWYNACTAGGTRKYPYGDEAVSGACGPSSPLKAVKSYPCCQGGVPGLYDMVGTAEEWIDGCQTQSTKGDHDQCLTESGSSCAGNGNAPRNRHDNSLGFRCCAP